MKPHIILIQSDQHNARIAGYAGDPWVRTPNLDRLAAEGVSLDACYCPSPLCVPSRMSMLAGQLPSEIGVWTNEQSLSTDTPTFVHSLAAGGYDTTLCGRMHFIGPDQRHGYHHRLVGDPCPTRLGGEKSISRPLDNSLGNTMGATRNTVVKSGAGSSRILRYDDAVRDAAVDWLEQLPEDASPQFLTVGLYGPHCSFVAPPELYQHYYEKLPLPELESPPHLYQKEFNQRCDLGGYEQEDLRRIRAAYYGMVEKLDSDIGTVIAAADRKFGRENYVLIYTSDHGEMLGEKDLICKTHFYDSSARVPFLARWSSHFPESRRIQEATSLLDLSPTLTAIGEGPSLPLQHGESLEPVLTGGTADTKRVVLSQFATTVDGYVSGMARDARYKYIYYHGYENPQLFDMQEDPWEKNDLSGQPDLRPIREGLHATLAASWDPEKIREQVIRSWQESAIVRACENKQFIPNPELWPGEETDDCLLKTDI